MAKKKVREEDMLLSEDPFLRGRTEAAERYGYLSQNAAQWRRISFVMLLFCCVSVGTVIYYSGTRTVIPYIVQVDRHGYEIAISPAAPSKIDSRMIISRIGRYIKSLKTVYQDTTAQTELMNFVYQSTPLDSPAERRYREFYELNNPFKNADKQIHVTVNTVLSLSETKWQAEWTEESFERGQRIATKQYRGIFDIAVRTPTEMREVLENPLGIFIADFTFTEITS